MTSKDPIAYWREGAAIVQACLDKAAKADPSDAPFPLIGEEAKLWHNAQVEAYRHALEMMGPSSELNFEQPGERDRVLEEAAQICEQVTHWGLSPTKAEVAKSTQNFCAKAIRAQIGA